MSSLKWKAGDIQANENRRNQATISVLTNGSGQFLATGPTPGIKGNNSKISMQSQSRFPGRAWSTKGANHHLKQGILCLKCGKIYVSKWADS
jgi:hypothetical protein